MIDLVQPFWKPRDWTSFDVVKKVRSAIKVRKVGHTGTLDPFAEGVLVLCLGAATKRISQLMDLEKEYRADVKLGVTTDTLDPTGTVTDTVTVPPLTRDDIAAVLSRFVGPINQVPPMFSAVKVNGERLYKLARAGKTVLRQPRSVHIYRLDLVSWLPPDELVLRVICGKGTYIRSLASDLAQALNTVGYLTSLERTRVGPYGRADAVRMEQLASWTPTIA
ncbi:MAG: tRNA pseudouridine(55) synthase TruB [Candidatus Neomarinimicrobiota bacterium]